VIGRAVDALSAEKQAVVDKQAAAVSTAGKLLGEARTPSSPPPPTLQTQVARLVTPNSLFPKRTMACSWCPYLNVGKIPAHHLA